MGCKFQVGFFPVILSLLAISLSGSGSGSGSCSGSGFVLDTISIDKSLKGNQTVVSKGGVFELGYFSPDKLQSWYIGIWYKEIHVQTVVWVANRETPLPDTSSELKISGNGNLVLLNKTQVPIWSTDLSSTSGAANSSSAVLLDNGNLVLKEAGSSRVTWQSLDHPTDTWLPGGKMRLNKKTRQNQLLKSWRNSEDPSPGLFSLGLDPNGAKQYLAYWNGSKRYWSSGEWDGHIFSAVLEMRLNYIYNFSFIDNENESYYNYSCYDNTTITRLVMDVTGMIRQYLLNEQKQTWNLFVSLPRDPCDIYAICGPFASCSQKLPFCSCIPGFEPKFPHKWNLGEWSGGCVRKTKSQCGFRKGERDGFWPINTTEVWEKSIPWTVVDTKDCEAWCLASCSCTAYAQNSGSDTCYTYTGDIPNLKEEETTYKLYIRAASSDLFPNSSRNENKKLPKIIAVCSVTGLLIIVGVILWALWMKLAPRRTEMDGSLMIFNYKDLKSATKNLSQKIGGGSFGSVFIGYLSDGTHVAIKRLEGHSQGEQQFRAEVSTIGTIQHINLIQLRGFCAQGSRRLLVYEYMSNSSLNFHLFQEGPDCLSWKTRYNIALGTARGIAYLHGNCRECIIHCDIKPGNILLDHDFSPKLTDFGLAKLMSREFSRVLTTIRGSIGYLAPEWLSDEAITTKADVYSYGMTLLELISGRRNADWERGFFFPAEVLVKMMDGKDLAMLDPRLKGVADVEEVARACRVAGWCVQEEEGSRPTMEQVVRVLEGVVNVDRPLLLRTLEVFEYN